MVEACFQSVPSFVCKELSIWPDYMYIHCKKYLVELTQLLCVARVLNVHLVYIYFTFTTVTVSPVSEHL